MTTSHVVERYEDKPTVLNAALNAADWLHHDGQALSAELSFSRS
jgi:hypothetical protein